MNITSADFQVIFDDTINYYKAVGLYVQSSQDKVRWYNNFPGEDAPRIVHISASPVQTSGSDSALDVIVKGIIHGITDYYLSGVSISAFGMSVENGISATSSKIGIFYNTTNLKIDPNGQINTVQDLSVSSSPTFQTINFPNLTNGQIVILSGGHLITSAINYGSGTTVDGVNDHSLLINLDSDDHVQYLILNPQLDSRNTINTGSDVKLLTLITSLDQTKNPFEILDASLNQRFSVSANGSIRVVYLSGTNESIFENIGSDVGASSKIIIRTYGIGSGSVASTIYQLGPNSQPGWEVGQEYTTSAYFISYNSSLVVPNNKFFSLDTSGHAQIGKADPIASAFLNLNYSSTIASLSAGWIVLDKGGIVLRGNNSTGTKYGYIQGTGNNEWSLGYKSNLDNLSEVNLLKWNDVNNIIIPGLSGSGDRYVIVASDGTLRSTSAIGSVSASAQGTINTLAKFVTSGSLGDSIVSENGSQLFINGSLRIGTLTGLLSAANGNVVIAPTLPISVGGTNNTSFTGARFIWYNGSSLVSSPFTSASFTSANGTPGRISKFITGNFLGDSTITESGTNISTTSSLNVSGATSLKEVSIVGDVQLLGNAKNIVFNHSSEHIISATSNLRVISETSLSLETSSSSIYFKPGFIKVMTLNSNSMSAVDNFILTNNSLRINHLSGATTRQLGVDNFGNIIVIGSTSANVNGTPGRISKFITSTSLGDSLIIESGSSISVSGNAIITGALNVSGVQSNSNSIVFVSNGTSGIGRIYKSASSGIVLRGTVGSSYDFSLISVAGNDLITNPTGTNNLNLGYSSGLTIFPGNVAMNSTLNVSGVTTFSVAPILAFASNRILYANSTGVISTTSVLAYDGTNITIGSGNTIVAGSGRTFLGSSLNVSGATTIGSTFVVYGASTFNSQIYSRSSNPNGSITGNTTDRGQIVVGGSSSQQLQIDADEIQSMNNITPATLYLNYSGADIRACISSNGLILGQDALAVGVLDVRARASGDVIAMFGVASTINASYPGYIYFSDANCINAGYNVNSNAQLGINWSGYLKGSTQYRDVGVYDGKTAYIAFFDGSSHRVIINNSTTDDGFGTLQVNGPIGARDSAFYTNASYTTSYYNATTSDNITPYFYANYGATLDIKLAPAGNTNPWNYFRRPIHVGASSDVAPPASSSALLIKMSSNSSYIQLDKDSTSYEAGIIFADNGTAKWYLFMDNTTDNYFQIQANGVSGEDDSNPRFRLSNTTKDMWLAGSGGGVGIGHGATPLASIDVRSGSSSNVIATFGCTTAVNSAYPGYIYFSDVNTINFGYNVNSNADGYINYRGYLNGTTQYRDLNICDGKGNVLARFDGSTGYTMFGSSDDPTAMIEVTSNTFNRIHVKSHSNSSFNDASIYMMKYRGTRTSPLKAENGDSLGIFGWYASNNTTGAYTDPAYIQAVVDGATAIGDAIPGKISFYTTPGGSGSVPMERMTIYANGNLEHHFAVVLGSAGRRPYTLTTTSFSVGGYSRLVFTGGTGNTVISLIDQTDGQEIWIINNSPYTISVNGASTPIHAGFGSKLIWDDPTGFWWNEEV